MQEVNTMSDARSSSVTLIVRILRFPPVRLGLLGLMLIFIMAVNGGFMERFKATPLISIAVTIAMAAAAVAVYFAYARLIEQRSVDEFSPHGMARELGLGLAVGAGLYTLAVLILIMLGVYRIEGLNPWTFVIPAVAMALSSGLFEELVFRGVVFRSIEDLFGSWIALIASALIFGLVHLHNPAATLTGALSISVEAGVLLAAAYMLTRRLWLSISFHMSWNYTQSAIFSGIVSGGVSEPGLIRSNIRGPELLTGGSFGLEASVIAFTLCTATGILLLVMAARRGKLVQPVWARKR